MEQFGFKYSMINGYNAYRITVDQLKTLAERRKWLHALDSDDIGEKDTDTLSDKSVDVSAAYTALLAKYKALLNQVSGIKKKGLVYCSGTKRMCYTFMITTTMIVMMRKRK